MENRYSVLMPIWYKENPGYLFDSIDSMARQTILPQEFVFVCDHELSPSLLENIKKATSQIPIVWVNADDLFGKGLSALLARGVKECNCELIARMDTDDIALPERCQIQLEKFNEISNLDIVGGTVAEFSDNPSTIQTYRKVPQTQKQILKFTKWRTPFNHPTVMFRKSSILKVGNYNSLLKKCEDYDLWYRVLNDGGVGYNIQPPVLLFRAGNALVARRKDPLHFQHYKALKKRMWKNHFINFTEYFLSIGIQSFFFYSPTSIKRYLYKRVLRKSKV